MKNQIFLLVLIIIFLSISVNAQSIESKKEQGISTTLRFNYTSSLNTSINIKLLKPTKKNSFLFNTGYLLQGLKYVSPMDRFNTTAPFDIRGYHPRSFSSYLTFIDNTRLLQQPINPIK